MDQPGSPSRDGAATREAFERQALEHLEAVHRLAFHLTRNPERADDLVQEVYLRAVKAFASGGFEPKGGGIKSWLFTIAHNTFYSDVARRRRAPIAGGDLFLAEDDQPPPGEPPPAWDRATMDWEQVDDRLRRAVEGLREEYREVLLLWGVEGLKYREIAEVLGVPLGTVMSRLFRARKLLADQIGPDLRPALRSEPDSTAIPAPTPARTLPTTRDGAST